VVLSSLWPSGHVFWYSGFRPFFCVERFRPMTTRTHSRRHARFALSHVSRRHTVSNDHDHNIPALCQGAARRCLAPTLLFVLLYSYSVGDRTLASFISTVSKKVLRMGKHSVEILLWTNTRNTTHTYIYNTLLCIDKRSGSGKALEKAMLGLHGSIKALLKLN
jgi:hypothetical protein